MNETSKCSQCVNNELCHIRLNLNRIIQDVIKNSENEVKKLSPKEIDYIICTDISIIPTHCENYKCRQESAKDHKRLFTFGRTMANAAFR